MKKFCLLMAAIACLAFFVGCSKGDGGKEGLEFIHIVLTSDEVQAPEAVMALFYLNGMDIDECPFMTPGSERDRMIAAKKSGSSDYIFPVTDIYGGDKFFQSSENSVNTIYWEDDLSSLYGTPQAGGKYVVFIQMMEGTRPKAYKKLMIDSNKKITVHLPKASEIGGEVEAVWKVEDFKYE